MTIANSLPKRPDWSRHALFLDFDGTLAPIVDRPEEARMSEKTRRAIERIHAATGGAVALLTGRALDDLDQRSGCLNLPAAGSHGHEMRGAGRGDRDDAASQALAGPARAIGEYAAAKGLLVENKPGAITLHYRSDPCLEGECRALVERLAAGDAALRAMHGDMVSEVALAGIDKGTALEGFMEKPPFAGRLPIVVGDDVTDEDAIRAATALGGYGIKIGPSATAADYRANNITTFLDWLDRMSRPDPEE